MRRRGPSAEAIDAFKAANVSGMIIDLRNNGGAVIGEHGHAELRQALQVLEVQP